MATSVSGRVKFAPSFRNIAKIGASPEMVAQLALHARDAADTARMEAPVDTGAYRDSISSEAGVEGVSAYGRVIAADFKANWIEFGTIRHPARAVLRRAVESVGLKVRSSR